MIVAVKRFSWRIWSALDIELKLRAGEYNFNTRDGSMPSGRDQVFISYSHKDQEWLARLQTMLKPLVRNSTISVWDDTKIKAGARWKEEIERALGAANVAVLLVSPNFLESDFIAKDELPPILNAAATDGLLIFWVYVSSCLYDETEIKDYQAAHEISKPLDSLTPAKRNAVLADVCRKIKTVNAAPQSAPTVGQKPQHPSHFNDYIYIDRRRLNSYSEQLGKSPVSEHEAIVRLIKSLKPLRRDLQRRFTTEGWRNPFVLGRLRARRAYFSRRFAGLEDGGGLGLWIANGLYLIEDPAQQSNDPAEFFSGYSALRILLGELGARAHFIDAQPDSQGTRRTVELAPDYYPKFWKQSKLGMQDMLSEIMQATLPQLRGTAKIGRCSFNDSGASMEVDFGEECFDVEITYKPGRDAQRPQRTELILVEDPGRALELRFSKDPVNFLQTYHAKVAPERDIDILFQVRTVVPDGTVGYPVVIAAAPSTLI
jgi:TIR domain